MFKSLIEENIDTFLHISDRLAVGIAIVDQDGCVVFANKADCLFLGYSQEEIKGMHFAEFTHPDDLTTDNELYQELIENKRESYIIDKRYFKKDGRVRS